MKAGRFDVISASDVQQRPTFRDIELKLILAGIVYSRFERMLRKAFEFKCLLCGFDLI